MITHLDHLVLTTVNLEKCLDFYARVLKMQVTTFRDRRYALQFGVQKINIHQYGQEFESKAHLPVPGALDLCFITNESLDKVVTHIKSEGISILEGPINRTGAMGPISSIYLRDPDLNLIEISQYIKESTN